MPELPEVENARQLVAKHAEGKRIKKATVADDEKVINDIAPQQLQEALSGRTLVAAKRRGKQMWWELDTGPALLLHFGMTGGLCIKGVGAAHYKSFTIDDAAWPPKYCKIELEFEDGTQLAFCDPRRFAKVRFLEAPEERPPISELGWDPILDWPPLEPFAARLGAQRRAIKAVLLDQSFSAGVGNWVADEVLYQARIHPEQPANSIPEEQVSALHRAIRGVCQLAVDADADSDRFPDDWLFHYRWGKGSSTKSKVGGNVIDHITVGGRTSAFVPALQKLRKAAAAAAAAPAGKKAAAAAKKAGGAGVDGSSKRATGGGRKRKQAAAEEAANQVAAAEVAAETAAEELAGEAEAAGAEAALPAPRRGRGKKGVAAATDAKAAAAEAPASSDKPGQGRNGKQRGQQQEAAEPQRAAGAAGAAAPAASGRGTKRFRTDQPAPEEEAPAAATRGKSSDANGEGKAAGRQRKAAGDSASAGGTAAVRARRGRA
ncbi:hypothetical protein ABPG77_009345 [Micractinium sp. CCAP 211/92]